MLKYWQGYGTMELSYLIGKRINWKNFGKCLAVSTKAKHTYTL